MFGISVVRPQGAANRTGEPVIKGETTMISRIALVSAMLAGGGLAPQAFAQTVPAPQPPAPQQAAPAASGEIEEIVVTAQRRSENLQSVPISVTALTASRLTSAGVLTTNALPELTPALTLADSVGFLEPKIRGIGNTSAGPGVENSVATYVDGVYISSAPGSLLSLSNIERVEVLKGPQGTLFGRNATGGLIQIVTKDPSHSFSGNADASYGNYDTSRVNFYTTGEITKRIAADIDMSLGHQGEGYILNPAHGKDIYKTDRDISLRSKWLLNIDDNTTARVSFDYENVASNDPVPITLPGTFNSYTAPLQYVPYNVAELNGGARHQIEAGGVSVRLDHDFGPITLTDIAAYRRTRLKEGFDADGTPAPAIYRTYTQNDEQVSEELQLTPSHKGRLTWVAGLYYYHLDSGFDPFTDYHRAPLANSTTTMLVDSITESIAGYGQVTYEILPRTNITGGFRYTEESRDLNAASRVFSGVTTTPLPLASLNPLPHQTISFDTPTARFSLDHTFENDVLAYFSYNRGFKSGGYNTQTPTAPPFAPEYLDAYEGGFKSRLFDRKVRLNLSAFLYEYKDIQVNTFVGSTPIIYNGASAETYGLDGDFDWVVTRKLSFNGGLTLLHDRFTDFPNAVVTIVLPNGHTTTAPGNATGKRLPFAPDAVINLGADYKQEIPTGVLELSLQNQVNTGYYGQPDNFIKQKAFDMLNATLTYRPSGGRYYASFFATNILNEHVRDFINSSTTGQTVAYDPPFLFGGRVGVNF